MGEPSRKRWTRAISLVILAALVSACSTTSQVKHIDRLASIDEQNPRILAMPPDIKYYLLTVGGVVKPHAEWTLAARSNFADALGSYLRDRDVDVHIMDTDAPLCELEIAYQKLYSAVGVTILGNHFGPLTLPTKQGSFDWSLGPGVKVIGETFDADYALFTFYRDYQATEGRVAFAMLAAVVGVGVSAGSEGGFASLVDLKTGEIVWFSLVRAGSGELRDSAGAAAAVEQLFANLPESSR
jgi:hypothetical protein